MTTRLVSVRLPETMYQNILAKSREGASMFIREAVELKLREIRRAEVDAAFAAMCDDDYDIEPEFYAASQKAVAEYLDKVEGEQ